MSALLQLHRALAAGNTLPWVLKYAKDGDRDAALARAWNEERNVRVLGRFIWDYHPLGRKPSPSYGLLPRRSRCYCARDRRHSVCDHCADEQRKSWKPPTWAEVERRELQRSRV